MAYDIVALKNLGLPANLLAEIEELKGNFGESFGESFARLSLKGSRFSLKSGQSTELLSSDYLDVVILGDAVADHCTYYAGKYDPANEDVKPTAVWLRGTDAPLVVPPAKLTKDADGRYGYSIQHRTVVAIVNPQTKQLDPNPVVFDVGSMSLYGKDIPMSNGTSAMSYSSYRRWCSSQGVPPCLLFTRVIFDTSSSVPSVRFIPARNGTAPMLLPPELLGVVLPKAKSAEVKDLLKVNLIDGTEGVGDAAPQPVAPQVQPQPAPQPVAQPAPQPVAQHTYVPQPGERILVPQEDPQPVAPAPQPVAPAPELQTPAPAPQPVDLGDPLAGANKVSAEIQADNQLMSILAEAGALPQ